MSISRISSLALLLALTTAAPVLAQNPAEADPGADDFTTSLDALVTSHEAESDHQRDQIASLLLTDVVREVAKDHDVNIGRVQRAAAAMTDSQVRALAPMIASVATVQEGNGLGSVTISVAAVIIILLLLILVS